MSQEPVIVGECENCVNFRKEHKWHDIFGHYYDSYTCELTYDIINPDDGCREWKSNG
jgi:hypothetical protein